MRTLGTLLIASAAWLAAQEGAVFRNETIGLEVTKPGNWFYLTAQESNDDLRKLKLRDPNYVANAINRGAAPLVAFAKYRKTHVGVIPEVTISAVPTRGYRREPASAIMKNTLRDMERAVKDFRLTHGPEAVNFQGYEAAYAQVLFTLETRDGFSAPIVSEQWVIHRGDFIFFVGAGMRWENNPQLREEISAIVNSIRLAR